MHLICLLTPSSLLTPQFPLPAPHTPPRTLGEVGTRVGPTSPLSRPHLTLRWEAGSVGGCVSSHGLSCRAWSCVELWLCTWKTCSVPGRSGSRCPPARLRCSEPAPGPPAALCQMACCVAPGESLSLSGPVTPVRGQTLGGETKRW